MSLLTSHLGTEKASGKALWVLLTLLLLGTAGASAVYLTRLSQAKTPESGAAAPADPTPEAVACLGRIEPQDGTYRIGARSLSGQPSVVRQLMVKAGDYVKTGQIIAILNSKDQLEATWRQAEANVEVSRTRLAQVQAGPKAGDVDALKAEIARLQIEALNAQTELKRIDSLYREGIVPETSLTASQLQVNTTRELITNAQQRLRGLEEVRTVDVNVAMAEIAARDAEVRRTQTEYEASIVRAPSDGRVVRVYAQAGEEVKPEGIVEVAKVATMYVVAEVAENDIQRIRVGQKATMRGDSLRSPMSGTVERISPEIQRTSMNHDNPRSLNNPRTVEVWILLDDRTVAENLIHAQVEVLFSAR